MKIINNPADFPKGVAVAFGAFDGIHIGHQKLIENTVAFAGDNNCKSCIYTFDALPSGAKFINSWEQKLGIFEKLGVDYVFIQKFDDTLKNTSAVDFLNKFVKNAKYVTVGFNFRFGKGREGNTRILEQFCNESGIAFDIVQPVYLEKEVVSSTKIRGYIEEDNFCTAGKMLGRNFCVNGVVIHGNAVGRTIGFPTANIEVDENRIMPTEGVYATVTEFEGNMYPSVTNYGGKPTFGDNRVLLETNIFDFDGDLYGKNISVHFLGKIRNIVSFASKEELKTRLERDKQESLKIFKKSLYK